MTESLVTAATRRVAAGWAFRAERMKCIRRGALAGGLVLEDCGGTVNDRLSGKSGRIARAQRDIAANKGRTISVAPIPFTPHLHTSIDRQGIVRTKRSASLVAPLFFALTVLGKSVRASTLSAAGYLSHCRLVR